MSRPVIDREHRMVAVDGFEVRASPEGAPPRIEGYAAIFNQPSEIINDLLGHYREIIEPGAFTRSIKAGADVRALLNHDPNFVLGRTRAGTLAVREDDKGLFYSVTPPDTQWARDLMETIRRGDISQSSFAFRTVKDRWERVKDSDGNPLDQRHQIEVQLFDVSPVTQPAYLLTSSAVRSLVDVGGVDPVVLAVLARASTGQPLTEIHESVLRATIDFVRRYLPADSVLTDYSAPVPSDPAPASHSAEALRVSPPIDPQRADRLRRRLAALTART